MRPRPARGAPPSPLTRSCALQTRSEAEGVRFAVRGVVGADPTVEGYFPGGAGFVAGKDFLDGVPQTSGRFVLFLVSSLSILSLRERQVGSAVGGRGRWFC